LLGAEERLITRRLDLLSDELYAPVNENYDSDGVNYNQSDGTRDDVAVLGGNSGRSGGGGGEGGISFFVNDGVQTLLLADGTRAQIQCRDSLAHGIGRVFYTDGSGKWLRSVFFYFFFQWHNDRIVRGVATCTDGSRKGRAVKWKVT
jgi:hypothetical protein